MAGDGQTKSSTVNIKTLADGNSKAKVQSSKPLMIGDIVHYAAATVGDRLTIASVKKEKSLMIRKS